MKKVLILLLSLLLLICPISCGEDTCENESHVWDDGKITTQATAGKEGIKTYTCTKCSDTKTTLIKALATDVQWKQALSGANFSNATVDFDEWMTVNEKAYKRTYHIESNESSVYYTVVSYENGVEVSYKGAYIVEALRWNFDDRYDTVDTVEVEFASNGDITSATNLLSNYGINVASCYESFTYNYETSCYEAENLKIDNVTFSRISVELDGNNVSKLFAVTDEENPLNLSFTITDYGKTTPNPPKS